MKYGDRVRVIADDCEGFYVGMEGKLIDMLQYEGKWYYGVRTETDVIWFAADNLQKI